MAVQRGFELTLQVIQVRRTRLEQPQEGPVLEPVTHKAGTGAYLAKGQEAHCLKNALHPSGRRPCGPLRGVAGTGKGNTSLQWRNGMWKSKSPHRPKHLLLPQWVTSDLRLRAPDRSRQPAVGRPLAIWGVGSFGSPGCAMCSERRCGQTPHCVSVRQTQRRSRHILRASQYRSASGRGTVTGDASLGWAR